MEKGRILNLVVKFRGISYNLKIDASSSYEQLCSEIEKIINISLEDRSIKLYNDICIPRDDSLFNNISDGEILIVTDSSYDNSSTVEIKERLDISDKKTTKIDFQLNLNFFDDNPSDDEDSPTENLTGILNLCLLKQIARNITEKQIKNIDIEEIVDIIRKLKNEIEFSKKTEQDIKSLLSEKSGNNILEYAKYVDEIIGNREMYDLLEILDENQNKEVTKYWKSFSKYQNYNEFFEKEISKSLKESYFEYSVISLAILSKQNRKKYEESKSQCPNLVKKILYHGTQIDPISKIMTTGFKYTRKAFYGMGIYFSDMLDYVGFYAGGTNYDNRRENFGKILPIKSNFSLIAGEIYYDKSKLKKVDNWNLKVDTLDHFPTYEEIQSKYKDKMVQKNGIHFVQVEPYKGQYIQTKELPEYKNDKGGFIGNEFVITENSQMLPIYCLTLERNEYFVLWRDPNFKENNEFTDYLKEMKKFANQIAKMNIYFESQTEEALKIIERKKYNKMILISSCGFDKSGKKFIEIARKILKFNVVVLFFSANKNNIEWIKKIPNALYTNDCCFYEKYITNFTEDGLKNLKKEIEMKYKITLPEFSKDFISYPLFKNEGKFGDFKFSEKYDFFRHVKIYNKNNDRYLGINNGKPVIVKKEESDKNIWDITIMGNEITLYSNGYYLMIEEGKKNVKGNQYMIRWNISVNNGKYKIYSQKNKNDILTIESGNSIKITNGKDDKNSTFEFIDI